MVEMEFSPVVLTALIDGLLQDQADEVCLDDELRYCATRIVLRNCWIADV